MSLFIYIVSNIAYYLLSALTWLLLARAVLSWLPIEQDGAIFQFLYVTTETVIAPVRAILDRFEAIRTLPIDISFIVTWFLVMFVQMFLRMFM